MALVKEEPENTMFNNVNRKIAPNFGYLLNNLNANGVLLEVFIP